MRSRCPGRGAGNLDVPGLDLEDIRAYVARDRPLAAERLANRLRTAAAALDRNAARGRPIGGDRRELTHVRPYVIRYRVAADIAIILEVRHAARAPD